MYIVTVHVLFINMSFFSSKKDTGRSIFPPSSPGEDSGCIDLKLFSSAEKEDNRLCQPAMEMKSRKVQAQGWCVSCPENVADVANR